MDSCENVVSEGHFHVVPYSGFNTCGTELYNPTIVRYFQTLLYIIIYSFIVTYYYFFFFFFYYYYYYYYY